MARIAKTKPAASAAGKARKMAKGEDSASKSPENQPITKKRKANDSGKSYVGFYLQPQTMKRLRIATAELDTTLSGVAEIAFGNWLDKYESGKGKRK